MIEPEMLAFRKRHSSKVTLRGVQSLAPYSRPWRLVPHKETGFHATVQTWFCRRLLLSRALGDGTITHRDVDHLGDGYDKVLLMVLLHQGGLTCEQRGRMATAGQGSIVTLLPRETFWSNALDGTDATMLYVPIDYLEGRGISTELLAAATWQGGPLLAGIRELVDSTMELNQEDGAGIHVEQALLELIVGLLGQYLNKHNYLDAPAQEVRNRVLAYIDDNYADPACTIDAIVAAVGVSRRYVYKVFEGHKFSVGSLLRVRRLEEAEVLLRAKGNRASLPRIARTVGFSGSASFSRVFKESRGMSPAEYRDRYWADADRGGNR